MKQKFLLALLAIGFTALSASATPATPEPERLVLTIGNVEHLRIEDNIDVILIQGAPDNYSLMMDQKTSEKLNLRLSKNKLVIAAQNGASKKQKYLVYVYVNNLRTITVDGDSQIKTFGSLKSNKIDLFIGGDAYAHVRSTGKIKVYSMDNSEIEVKYLSGKPVAKKAF
jgi:hypothetical protein